MRSRHAVLVLAFAVIFAGVATSCASSAGDTAKTVIAPAPVTHRVALAKTKAKATKKSRTHAKAAAAGLTCMPDPSACGFPDVETTGVTPGTALTQMSGVVTLNQPGQVLQNASITGSILVTAQNVTIRNVRLINTDDFYAVGVKPGNDWDRGDANLLLDHVEINLNGHSDVKGIAFNGFTLRNVFIHNGADCVHFSNNVRVEDSMCTIGPDTDNDGWPDAATTSAFCNGTDHFDGLQFSGGGNITINHNTIRNPCSQTSDILISNDPGYTKPITGVAVTNNLLAGGGYSLYCADADDTIANEVVTGNVFSKTFFAKGGYYGQYAYCEHATTFSGNVSDGNYVPPPNTGGGGTGTGTGTGTATGTGTGAAPGTTGPSSGALDVGTSTSAYLLTRRQARSRVASALSRQLGRRYSRRAGALRLTCHRGSHSVFTCGVGWTLRSGGTLHRYTGSVRIARIAKARYRYAIALRSWSSGCRCSAPVRRKGTL
jgi:hypothetical protein